MVTLDITDQPNILAQQYDEDVNDDPDLWRQMLHAPITAWLDEARIAYRCRVELGEGSLPTDPAAWDRAQVWNGACWSVLILRSYIDFLEPDAAVAFKMRWWSGT